MVISSVYTSMDKKKQKLMDENKQYLADMLDFAIKELVEIAEDNEVYLVDNMRICKEYEDIFNCLKHRAQKRKG